MKLKEQLKIAAALAIILTLVYSSVTVVAQTSPNQFFPPSPIVSPNAKVPTPKSILGYDLGSNGTFTPWNMTVKYFLAVANSTGGKGRVKVFQFGTTALGRPMIIGVVTSQANWGKMPLYLSILKQLSDPRTTSPAAAQSLAQLGLPVFWIEASQHSDESGSVEMSMDLLYKLASTNEPDMLYLLNNLIIVINPCQNPDGHDMWVNWHYQWGPHPFPNGPATPYYDTQPPYWSKYVSHDNNRDWFKANLPENQYNEKVFQQWRPQVFEDHHEPGVGDGILFTPVISPVNPDVSPIVKSGWILYGGWIHQQATTNNLPGYVSGEYALGWDDYYPGYGDSWPSLERAYGMTYETASAHYDRAYLAPQSYSQQAINAENTFWNDPMPWTGGPWTLMDNINYQEWASLWDMQLTATYRENILWSYYQMGYQQVQIGKTQPPYAYAVPMAGQWDPATAAKMLNTFISQGVEVNLANQAFTVNGCSINLNSCATQTFPAGTYLIRMDQPLGNYAKDMLTVQDHAYSATNLPYDVTAWTEPYEMGVATYNVTDPSVFTVPMSLVSTAQPPAGGIMNAAVVPATTVTVTTTVVSTTTVALGYGYAFSHNMNNAIIAINQLLTDGITPYLAASSFTGCGGTCAAGSVIVPIAGQPGGLASTLNNIGKALYIPIYPIQTNPGIKAYKLTKPNIGIYYDYGTDGYSGPYETMDEGWTRLLFDNYGISYTRLNSLSFDTGYVNGTGAPLSSFSAIIIPPFSINPATSNDTNTKPPGYQAGYDPHTPVPNGGNPNPVYGEQLGLDSWGVKNLKNWVQEGGTLICEDMSVTFAVQQLGLSGVSLVDTSAIDGPGVIVHLTNIANTNPIAFGLRTDNPAFWEYSSAFTVKSGTVLATYDSGNPWMSGYLSVPSASPLIDCGNNATSCPTMPLSGKAAAVLTTLGSGNVVLFGFRVLNRDQMDSTFQLEFNAVYYSTETPTNLP